MKPGTTEHFLRTVMMGWPEQSNGAPDNGVNEPYPIGQSGPILVIEDDVRSADLIEDMLAEMGHPDVTRAATVEEALERLREIDPIFAVLDANLRGMPAHRVADALRQRGIPFIVSTGYDLDALPAALQDGIMLKKPYDRRALIAAFNDAVARKRR